MMPCEVQSRLGVGHAKARGASHDVLIRRGVMAAASPLRVSARQDSFSQVTKILPNFMPNYSSVCLEILLLMLRESPALRVSLVNNWCPIFPILNVYIGIVVLLFIPSFFSDHWIHYRSVPEKHRRASTGNLQLPLQDRCAQRNLSRRMKSSR